MVDEQTKNGFSSSGRQIYIRFFSDGKDSPGTPAIPSAEVGV
jgi:hypothetical protein